MTGDLPLTPDQSLRLALLDRCLPVAGAAAVAMAEDAYAFVVGQTVPPAATEAAKGETPARDVTATARALVRPLCLLGPDEERAIEDVAAALQAERARAAPTEPLNDGPAVHAAGAETCTKTAQGAEAVRAEPAGDIAETVLAALREALAEGNDQPTNAALAARLGCSSSTIAKALNALEEAGRIRREGVRRGRRFVFVEGVEAAATPEPEPEPDEGPEPEAVDRKLAALIAQGRRFKDIGATLGLDWKVVRDRAALLGLCGISAEGTFISPHDPAAVSRQTSPAKRRACLRCRAEFLSAGPQNRMCPSCRRVNDGSGLEAAS